MRFNEDRAAENQIWTFEFSDESSSGNQIGVGPDLGLSELHVICSENTASAAEVLINSLKGIDFPVYLYGSRTEGKNVGMEVEQFKPGDGYSYVFAPISFQGYNAKRETVNPKGIDPDHAVDERATATGWYADYGPEEPLVHKALELIGVVDASRTTRGTQCAGMQLKGSVQQAVAHPQGMLCTEPVSEE